MKALLISKLVHGIGFPSFRIMNISGERNLDIHNIGSLTLEVRRRIRAEGREVHQLDVTQQLKHLAQFPSLASPAR